VWSQMAPDPICDIMRIGCWLSDLNTHALHRIAAAAAAATATARDWRQVIASKAAMNAAANTVQVIICFRGYLQISKCFRDYLGVQSCATS